MTNENITLTQLIDRLSAKEKPINLKYIECLRNRLESFWHNSISYSIETYYPLLESINTDVIDSYIEKLDLDARRMGHTTLRLKIVLT